MDILQTSFETSVLETYHGALWTGGRASTWHDWRRAGSASSETERRISRTLNDVISLRLWSPSTASVAAGDWDELVWRNGGRWQQARRSRLGGEFQTCLDDDAGSGCCERAVSVWRRSSDGRTRVLTTQTKRRRASERWPATCSSPGHDDDRDSPRISPSTTPTLDAVPACFMRPGDVWRSWLGRAMAGRRTPLPATCCLRRESTSLTLEINSVDVVVLPLI